METVNPMGYLFAADTNIELESAVKEVTIKEQPQYGRIELKKLDSETNKNEPQGAASLEKATYEIYNSAGTLLETLVTDIRGEAVSDKYPLGIYTVKKRFHQKGTFWIRLPTQ